jgi:hypothetical protein
MFMYLTENINQNDTQLIVKYTKEKIDLISFYIFSWGYLLLSPYAKQILI